MAESEEHFVPTPSQAEIVVFFQPTCINSLTMKGGGLLKLMSRGVSMPSNLHFSNYHADSQGQVSFMSYRVSFLVE